MRAICVDLTDFQGELKPGCSYTELRSSKIAHLNVVRLKVGEQVLLLPGNGKRYLSIVKSIEKKRVHFEIQQLMPVVNPSQYSLLLGHIKKRALERALTIAVEVGFRQIALWRSQYSEKKMFPNKHRLHEIIEGAQEQSNNSYRPELFFLDSAEDALKFCLGFDRIFVLNPGPGFPAASYDNEEKDKILYVVGPEAGLGEEDREMLTVHPNRDSIGFPGPIMRSPTAVAAAGAHAQFFFYRTSAPLK